MADGDQTEAIDFLTRGESYGRPGETPQRVETHASIVFLIGDRAYKLKRAVQFSYLDYGSAASRARFCRAELDLNRRTAPALYLAVRAITRGAAGALEWDGTGDLVEPVLEMKRFADDALLDRAAADGRLTPALIVRLADAVAAFHARAEAAAPAFGGSRGIASVLADNQDNLLRGCPPLDRAAVEALGAASAAALARHAGLLDARQMQGKVRRCHGDLHLRNICLLDGEPTLFDCIEFSDDIACIDVLYDLAFLLMDLEHRNLRPLANILFNRYIDRADETDGLAAVPLLMSIRAGVRAKVALAALAVQPGAAEEARAYLDLARALLRPGRPALLAIGGLSGTGKSTIAARLAAEFAPAPGARHIRSDVLRKSLMKVAPETRLPQSAYARGVSERVYRAMHQEAAAALAAGYTAILDATFIDEKERDAAVQLARDAGAAFAGLWLTAPEAVLVGRVEARSGDASDADRSVLMQQLRAHRGNIAWRVIGTEGNAESAIAAARHAAGLSST